MAKTRHVVRKVLRSIFDHDHVHHGDLDADLTHHDPALRLALESHHDLAVVAQVGRQLTAW